LPQSSGFSISGRGLHETVHRQAGRLFAALAASVVLDHFFLRPRNGRSGRAARRARRERSGHCRHSPPVRPRPAALGAIRDLHVEPVSRRCRAIVLLPDAGHGDLSVAAAQLADPGSGRDGLVLADRHSKRHPCGGAGRVFLGQRRKSIRAAWPVAAVLLGRPGLDLGVLGLSWLVAVLGRRRAAAPDNAGLCSRLVFRCGPHAADALLDARSAELGICQARG
jgi:hypothetical protein